MKKSSPLIHGSPNSTAIPGAKKDKGAALAPASMVTIKTTGTAKKSDLASFEKSTGTAQGDGARNRVNNQTRDNQKFTQMKEQLSVCQMLSETDVENAHAPTPGMRYKEPERIRSSRILEQTQRLTPSARLGEDTLYVRLIPNPGGVKKQGCEGKSESHGIAATSAEMLMPLPGLYYSNGQMLARVISVTTKSTVIQYPAMGGLRKKIFPTHAFIQYLKSSRMTIFGRFGGKTWTANGMYFMRHEIATESVSACCDI